MTGQGRGTKKNIINVFPQQRNLCPVQPPPPPTPKFPVGLRGVDSEDRVLLVCRKPLEKGKNERHVIMMEFCVTHK